MLPKGYNWLWVIGCIILAGSLMRSAGSKLNKIDPPNDDWFQTEVVNQGKPVLVKFGAEWCGPCRAMEPVLAELSKSMAGHIHVVEIDVDKHPGLASHYRISAIPRLFLFDHGKVVADRVGSETRDGLLKWIDEHFSK